MSGDRAERPQEIVIVRRRSGDDAAAVKGGAWKIAYADFVTAMMAFFLVMWLINASNEETRAQVASYFNPIKLTDSSTGARGLKDNKDNKAAQKVEGETTAGGSPPAAADAKEEAEVLANPDKLLAALEAKAEAKSPPGAVTEMGSSGHLAEANSESAVSGTGDPFDPASWELNPAGGAETPPLSSAAGNGGPASLKAQKSDLIGPSAVTTAGTETDGNESAPRSPPATRSVAAATQPSASVAHATGAESVPEVAKAPVHPTEEQVKPPLEEKPDPMPETEAIAAELAAKLGTGLDQLEASIDVKKIDEGTLISLTDKQSFGMFRSGSAEPQPELVRLVEAIAGVLASRRGYIVVRGHTDSRPYRNKKYDNWQLSTARAHLAQYMLVRGGVDIGRIRRIEGVADRDPRNPADPQAPENRRIEILLGRGES